MPTVASNNLVDISRLGIQDTDGDGVTDQFDNCTLIPNPSQFDADEDGFGNRCDADFDNNCAVNFLDVIRYKAAFNSFQGDPNYDPVVDISENGAINFLDYIMITGTFLLEPGPSNVECSVLPSS
ncbi:MAG: thrombospondin type 3 repeat-containing protein [Pseudomonadota bacterium]